MGYLVSFCIPEHNECNLVLELVQSLLSNPDPNFQVVVSDNMTDNADPSEVYRDIQDERFRLYQTREPLSRQEHFLRLLEYGEGKYLYLVMGRDWLDGGKIGKLLPLLRLAREDHVDLMIDRKAAESYKLCHGIDALDRFIMADHPTGLIVSRAALLASKKRNEYFIPGALYPEMFLKRDIFATGGKSAMISSEVFGDISTRVSLGKRLSGADPFNDWTNMENVYFSPKQILRVFREEVGMVLDDPRFHLTMAERAAFFERKYQELLWRSVFENKVTVQSEEFMMHYGMRRTYVPLESMFSNLTSAALNSLKEGYRISLFQRLRLAKSICAVAERIIRGAY